MTDPLIPIRAECRTTAGSRVGYIGQISTDLFDDKPMLRGVILDAMRRVEPYPDLDAATLTITILKRINL